MLGGSYSARAAEMKKKHPCLLEIRDITLRVGKASEMSKPPSTTPKKLPLHLKFKKHPSFLVSEAG